MAEEVWIEIRGLRVRARIGVTDTELETERPLTIDIDLIPVEVTATESDELAGTVDYAAVAALAERVATGGPHRTLERLAAEIADAIIGDGRVAEVGVRVAKPDPPTDQEIEAVAVRVARSAG